MESNQTAAREARRFLADRVRDDWDWPNLPPSWSESDEELRGVTQFRERTYGTASSSEPEMETELGAGDDPYKFDSPDSIAVAVETTMVKRKRRRRRTLEDEMKWNEGLVCFSQRRDAWTGADAVRKYGAHDRNSSPPAAAEPPTSDADTNASLPSDASSYSSAHNLEGLIPVARPLLRGNPIRDAIGPKVYPEIYNKVVVSARTPSVPINLSDMTRALVQGWKDNGEWPPKAGPLDPLAGRKKGSLAGVRIEKSGDEPFLAHHPHVKKGMDSVKRIFHLSGSHGSGSGVGDAG